MRKGEIMATTSRKKILVIEDDPLIRSTISSFLKDQNFETIIAEDGSEGIDLFSSEKPEIVLTDLRMPKADGLEVLASIRKKSPDTPVIIVSGMGTMADVIESLKLGAWDYITKPIQDIAVIGGAVNRAIEVSNLRKLKKRYQEHLQDEVQKRTIEIQEQNKEIRQLSQAVEQSGSSIVMTDLNGHIVYVNRTFEENTGYSREEAIGQNPRILKTDFLDNSHYENLWKTIVSGGVWRGEFNNKRKDGSTFWEKAIISPVYDKKGTIVNFMAVKEDITLIRAAEQKMIAAKKKAEEANEAKNRFLNNVSHELRTPLNGIMGYVSLLQSEPDVGQKYKEWLDVIEKSSVNLNDLITQIIQFSEMIDNEKKIETSRFSPMVLTNNIHRLLKPEAETKGLAFICSAPEILPEYVIGDQGKIELLLTHLIRNAIKFTDRGSIRLSVTAVIDEGNEYDAGANITTLHFSVEDTGIGIDADNLDKIFNSFYQVDGSSTRNQGGMGIGLAIVKVTTEFLGGEYEVKSNPGAGSVFKIHIPVSRD